MYTESSECSERFSYPFDNQLWTVGHSVTQMASEEELQMIALFIADEVQLIGRKVGPMYKVIISRMQYVSAQTEIKTHIVACGVLLANA